MATPIHHKNKVRLEHFSVLAPFPPFVDVIFQRSSISPQEFHKIAEIAAGYPNDPRMVEMVRKAGDASAKVPYLMDSGETPQSILAALRSVAAPHVQRLKQLPEPVQATIHTLLSINMVPRGYEVCGIPALLEINRMQREMTAALREMMTGRQMAQEFHANNLQALTLLDQEWLRVRKTHAPWPFVQSLPETTRMQYIPIQHKNCVVSMREVCVIVDAPDARELHRLTPPVLQNPLPQDELAPVTGSEDWLLRVVGKVGRHFTRALLDIIASHLEAERIHPSPQNFEQINYEAHEALRGFIEGTP
jgi:hypothetical protein